MLQWFIRFPEFAEFTEFLFHFGKTPMIPLIYMDAAGPTEIMTKSQVEILLLPFKFSVVKQGWVLSRLWLYSGREVCVISTDISKKWEGIMFGNNAH